MRCLTSVALALLLLAPLSLGGCGKKSSTTLPTIVDPAEPVFSAALFTTAPTSITNPYFPLVPGTTSLFQKPTDDGMETIVEDILPTTRVVAGVPCVIVRVREYLGELIIEDTYDWYAQDDLGNVWYMGENVTNYEYDDDGNLLSTDTGGSWEAGQDVAGVGSDAIPGILMKAARQVGDTYRQELYPTEAEDMGEISALNVTVTLACGAVHTCLRTRDWNPLEPGMVEFKYYAPGIGLVMEESEDGVERTERRGTFLQTPASIPPFSPADFSNPTQITNPFFAQIPERMRALAEPSGDPEEDGNTVIQQVLTSTRVVNGVTCIQLRVREYEGELITEDTHDWFAQDDSGNVWYFGESVVNYEYDDDDNLISTNTNGSWEAGVDGAVAGILMWANPVVGSAYYQEFYAGEAEDMGQVIAMDQTVTLRNRVTYTGCLKVLDWTPLEPETLEYKYYAPGLGLIAEETLDGETPTVELVSALDESLASLPAFASASFTNPTVIDNGFLPLTPGASFHYEIQTDEGLETIQVDVLPTTRVVHGVTCVVVRDQVHLDGVIQEDTMDWFAQDDAGNVWYMGEDVINYEYDDDGNLVGTNSDGSWESGVDGAVAGIQMWATPVPGTSYFQEHYAGEAEDLGHVLQTGVTVTLADGTVFNGCVQIFEWTPPDPGGSVEFKYYAPGFGLVLEEKPVSGERVEYVAP